MSKVAQLNINMHIFVLNSAVGKLMSDFFIIFIRCSVSKLFLNMNHSPELSDEIQIYELLPDVFASPFIIIERSMDGCLRLASGNGLSL